MLRTGKGQREKRGKCSKKITKPEEKTELSTRYSGIESFITVYKYFLWDFNSVFRDIQ